jgi:DNA repair protein RecO (recombination protein O)
LLADGTQDYDPHPALFDAAIETLRGLGDGSDSPREQVTAFELAWLRELGYSPRLDACASCGTPFLSEVTEGTWFSPSSGGVLCPTCGLSVLDRHWISLDALRELRAVLEKNRRVEPSIPQGVFKEIRQFLGSMVCFVLGKRPKLLGYIDGR